MYAADTPGVHLHHRLPHLLSPEELKELHPRKRLRPYYPPLPQDLTPHVEEAESRGSSAQGTDMAGYVALAIGEKGVKHEEKSRSRLGLMSCPHAIKPVLHHPKCC